MARVNIVCEGPSESRFISDILAPHLWPRSIYLQPMLLGIPGHKGGRVNYARVRKDILLQLKQDANIYCSTMLDFYGLRQDFPGSNASVDLSALEKASRIESAVLRDISMIAPEIRAETRLIPYIQVHEYEGLLFSGAEAFAGALGKASLAPQLALIRGQFETPEHINDSPDTAPSKRILQIYPQYRKVIEGTLAAQRIGIERMLAACPHFRGWIDRLAALPPEA